MGWLIQLLVTVGAVLSAFASVLGVARVFKLTIVPSALAFAFVAVVLGLIANGPFTNWYGSGGQPTWAKEMEERYNNALLEQTRAEPELQQALAEPDFQEIANQVRREDFELGVEALEQDQYSEALKHFEASASPTLTDKGRMPAS